MNKKKNIGKFITFIFIITILLYSCNGDSETSSTITKWLEQPITEMSIIEFILIIFFIGFITN